MNKFESRPQSVRAPPTYCKHITFALADLRQKLCLGHVTVVDDSGCEEGHKTVEDFCVLPSARVAGDRAHLEREVHYKASILQPVQA